MANPETPCIVAHLHLDPVHKRVRKRKLQMLPKRLRPTGTSSGICLASSYSCFRIVCYLRFAPKRPRCEKLLFTRLPFCQPFRQTTRVEWKHPVHAGEEKQARGKVENPRRPIPTHTLQPVARIRIVAAALALQQEEQCLHFPFRQFERNGPFDAAGAPRSRTSSAFQHSPAEPRNRTTLALRF